MGQAKETSGTEEQQISGKPCGDRWRLDIKESLEGITEGCEVDALSELYGLSRTKSYNKSVLVSHDITTCKITLRIKTMTQ